MGTGALRLVVLAALVWVVWLMWRSLRRDPTVARISGLGLAVRALAGVALFWVSYLALPIGRSLQRGDGLWFIAEDAVLYYPPADAAAAAGLGAIWGLNPTLPSVVYIQMLALLMWIVGRGVAAALLLNVIAFLALCTCVTSLASLHGTARSARLFALAAVSFSPAWILWATQPLKDSVFVALIAAFALGLAHWTNGLRAGERAALLGGSAAMWGVVYAVSGIRWYFGLLLLAGMAVSAGVAVLTAPGRRFSRAALAMLLLVVLAQAVPIGAGPFLPEWSRQALSPWQGRQALESWREIPARSVAVADTVRNALAARGGTEIRLGTSAPGAAESSRPTTAVQKLFAGAVAMVVPRTLAQAAGLVQIGGGRGLWAFADFDTLVLDIILIGAVLLVVGQLRRGLRPTPAFWGVLTVTALIGGALAYEGSNFGTLFRQRGMVAIGVMLLPLLLTSRAGPRRSGATAPD